MSDSYGYRKIEYNWRIDDMDSKFISEIIDSVDQNISKQNGMTFSYTTDKVAWSDRASSAAHHLGGCIMGHDPNNSVVDKNSRVHGYKNFYICDGSVFASAGNANPTFTIMALSNRLGRHLTNV
jgi:choline dehydrogenase-like flavoprotein